MPFSKELAAALMVATEANNLKKVKAAIQQNANINCYYTATLKTPLFIAAENGYDDIAEFLLSHENTNIESRNNHGSTPLIIAAYMGHTRIVRMLITRGALVNAVNNHGRSALSLAAQQGFTDIANLLITKGANVNARGGTQNNTPLLLAGHKEHTSIVKLLLNAGANPLLTNNDNQSAATYNFTSQEVRKLIKESLIPKAEYTRIQEIVTSLKIFGVKLEEWTDIPSYFKCPLSKSLMINPVIAADGFAYDKTCIKKWIKECTNNDTLCKSPMTQKPLSSLELFPSVHHQTEIFSYLENKIALLKQKIKDHKESIPVTSNSAELPMKNQEESNGVPDNQKTLQIPDKNQNGQTKNAATSPRNSTNSLNKLNSQASRDNLSSPHIQSSIFQQAASNGALNSSLFSPDHHNPQPLA